MYSDRFSKLQDSLAHMGISIISGAITSLSSTVPLFFALTILFSKIATLMLSTICFAIFFAMWTTTSIILIIGPVGHCGDLIYYVIRPLIALAKIIKNKWCRSKQVEDYYQNE